MQRAFTLAENLIVIALIGVIAVLTILVLINNVNKQITEAKLKKMYSMLSDAFEMADAKGATTYIADKDSASTETWFLSTIADNLRITKYCADKEGCWNGGTTMLDGSKPYYDKGKKGIGDNNITFVVANGYMVNMDGYLPNDLKSKMGVNTANDGVVMYVDINGSQKPNIVGRDVYVFVYTAEKGLVPAGADKSDSDVRKSCEKTGLFCLQMVARDGWSAKNLKL